LFATHTLPAASKAFIGVCSYEHDTEGAQILD